MTKIGIFGGAFDPPHLGHINLVKEAIEDLKLNKMLIVPTKKSPHKKSSAISYPDRLEMARLAFEGVDKTEISDIEAHLSGTSYTIHTIRALKELYPSNVQFYLLIGGDMLFYFEKWYRYESILGECKVVAAARHDDEYINMLEYATELGRVKVLNIPVIDVSSTEIREKIKNGESTEGLIPESVRGFIDEKKIYTEG